MTDILIQLFEILIFPGLLFLAVFALLSDWGDRKFYARMQNRVGPPWYQPLADFIKLISKETIIPKHADKKMFKLLPYVAIAAVVTVIFMIPLTSPQAKVNFQGDLIVVAYLLSIPTMCFFLAGWSSASPYSSVGAMRVITQFFAYEVPLTLVLLGPAILANSWNIADISAFYTAHPMLMLVNILGFIVAIITLQGKLERVPFDIPHAETEIVGGVFTEYSGKLYGFIRLAMSMELIAVTALFSAIFMGGPLGQSGILAFIIFCVKLLVIVWLSALIRSLMARVRIEQMINFCWKILVPLAILQIIISIIVKELI